AARRQNRGVRKAASHLGFRHTAVRSRRPMAERIQLFDTTLRDGTQGEGISFSADDKIRIAQRLDAFGIDYIEGGWPGSNPKDVEFFERVREAPLQHARLSAFGSTRRAGIAAEDRSEEHTSELQSRENLVCRLLLEKK